MPPLPASRICRLATVIALTGAPAVAAAEVDVLITAGGHRVAKPAPETLDCAGMRAVLDAIDATGYRGNGPAPLNPADAALFDYENRVSQRYYAQCVLVGSHAPMGNPFNLGYRP